jgi:hypothetical protein
MQLQLSFLLFDASNGRNGRLCHVGSGFCFELLSTYRPLRIFKDATSLTKLIIVANTIFAKIMEAELRDGDAAAAFL